MKGEDIMSKEAIRNFMEVLFTDKLLFEKFILMNNKFEGQTSGGQKAKEIFDQELTPMLSEAGFEFSYEDLLEYAEQQTQSIDGKLTDDQLDTVSGGFGASRPTLTTTSVFGVIIKVIGDANAL